MDLFTYAGAAQASRNAPLAVRMRPLSFAEFFGQEDVVGPGRFLRRMVEADQIPSLILFGPPGSGKTTLAWIIARGADSHFEKLNAVAAGVADIRRIVEKAREQLKFYQKRTILFIDEIHRFNKSQQDALLPYVEDGQLILIGATTENPYFEVNRPLLSRARVVRLQALTDEQLTQVLRRALADGERGLGGRRIVCDADVLRRIAQAAGGDARVALNILEQAALMLPDGGAVTTDILREVVGEKLQAYDKAGDNHYDVASAFIKSMRGSDPDAALHYLARMLAAGEDVNFIARRVVICAAEDVGNADPQALVLAMAAAQAVQFVGMPEARIPLAQAVTYIAAAPKSNAAYLGVDRALADVRQKNCGPAPPHLRDANYSGAKKLGHGLDYQYPHDYPDGFVRQDYLPAPLRGKRYYEPTARGRERALKTRLEKLRGQ